MQQNRNVTKKKTKKKKRQENLQREVARGYMETDGRSKGTFL